METPAEPALSRAQIVTLTMNPALGITTSISVVRPTEKLRCETTRYDPGGGGINVARIAHVLGGSVSAVFPAGGPTCDLVMSLLNNAGVPFSEQARCLDQLRMAAESAEFVVVSGSLPPGVPADYYQRVADICRQLGARLILDTSGGALQRISFGVFLLKA
jgi:6-phosphofructokinase 2